MNLVGHFANGQFMNYVTAGSWPSVWENLFKRLFLKWVRYENKLYEIRLVSGQQVWASDWGLSVLYDIFLRDPYFFDAKAVFGNRRVRFFDGGGNLGFVPIYLDFNGLKFFGDIVEPDPANLAILKKNVKGYDLAVHEVAVADQDGILPLFIEGSWNNSLYSKSGLSNTSSEKSIPVKVVPFDSFGVYDLVKLDIEGAEHAIIRNQENWKKAKYLIIEFHGSREEIDKSVGMVKEHFNVARKIDEVYHFTPKEVI
jgi:FkbM family methyltransferase